jgi:hypothetical protein
VLAQRLHGDEVGLALEGPARLAEQVAQHCRQGGRTRPRVPAEPVLLDEADRSADAARCSTRVTS